MGIQKSNPKLGKFSIFALRITCFFSGVKLCYVFKETRMFYRSTLGVTFDLCKYSTSSLEVINECLKYR